MAYTPTQWSPGDSITSAKLNKIEDGIANNSGGIFWVTGTVSEGSSSGNTKALLKGSVASDSSESSTSIITLNKTAREIIEAMESKIVLIKMQDWDDEEGICIEECIGWGHNSGDPYMIFSSNFGFHALTLDDYPSNGSLIIDGSSGTPAS